jgi:hypothetical protein
MKRYKDQAAASTYINPGLMPGTQTDAGEDWVEYKMNNGTTIRNQNATVTTLPKTGG